MLERQGDDSTWAFRHPLFRDTAYQGLGYRTRRQLHQRIGEALEERGGDVAVLATHFHAAGNWRRAWQYAPAAAEDAEARFANATAADLYQLAVDAGLHLGDVGPTTLGDLYERLGLVTDRLGDNARARRAFRSARMEFTDAVDAARMLFNEGQMRERTSEFTQALRFYRRGLNVIASRDDPDALERRSRLLIAQAQVALHRYELRLAITRCEEAEELARAAGDERAQALAHSVLYAAHLSLGTPDRRKYRELPAAVFRRRRYTLGRLSLLGLTAVDDYMTGEWNDALRAYEEQRKLATETGFVGKQAEAAVNTGEVLADQGHWELAADRLHEALSIYVPAGNRRNESFARIQLGRVAAATGDLDAARYSLDRAAGDLAQLGVVPWELLARARRLEVDATFPGTVAQAEVAEAAAGIDRRAESVAGGGQAQAVALRAAGVAAARAGRGEEAARCLTGAIDRARAAGSRYEWAITLEVWHGLAALVAEPPPAAAGDAQTALAKLGVVDHLLRRAVPISP